VSHRLLCRSVWDLSKSMYRLRTSGPLVTVFASAGLGPGTEEYRLGRDLGKALAEAGFAVMTGGGCGLMEAVNRGAREGGGASLGCRMSGDLFEREQNDFLDRCATVRYFFVRKVVMCRPAVGFVVLPGGLGTLDELFDVLTLIKTRRMPPRPIVLLGSEFWQPLMHLLACMTAAGTIAASHMPLLTVTDDIGQAVALVGRQSAPPDAQSLRDSIAIRRAS
jgi:uncharacterized protein (TIGR00730 family)